jgi:hypothetical protein
MRRIVHDAHSIAFLVIVKVIDKFDIRSHKSKDDPPVPIDRNGMKAPELAGEWMQLPSRGGEIARPRGGVKGGQLHAQLGRVLRLNPSLRAFPIKRFEALVPEAPDHV